MSSDEDNRAKLWGVDPEVLKREEEKAKEEPSAPKQDKTREDAARLGIELPPLPQWASLWLKRPLIRDGDLVFESYRHLAQEHKEAMCRFPLHSVVWCSCCNDFRMVIYAEPCAFEGPYGLIHLVTLVLADNATGKRHPSIAERCTVVGYKRGLEPQVMRALCYPSPASAN
jgi:hypothetical protein